MSDVRDLESLLSKASKEPVLLARETVRCPACGQRTLELSEYIYEVPYFNKIIITSGTCRSCGFRYRDVRLAEATGPKKIVVRVKGEKQLRYLLVKSAMAAVYIPEKGYEMVPGPASQGFISTVEGILHRFMEALELVCRDSWEREGCRDNKEWLENAIEGREEFTLVICDYEGTSKVLGEDVEEKPLDEECNRILEKAAPYLGYTVNPDSRVEE